MKRLKLEMDALEVESFATDERMPQRGTVRGADSDPWGCSSLNVTYCNDDTCAQTCPQGTVCVPSECCGPDQQDSGGCGTGQWSDFDSCAGTCLYNCIASYNDPYTCVAPCTRQC